MLMMSAALQTSTWSGWTHLDSLLTFHSRHDVRRYPADRASGIGVDFGSRPVLLYISLGSGPSRVSALHRHCEAQKEARSSPESTPGADVSHSQAPLATFVIPLKHVVLVSMHGSKCVQMPARKGKYNTGVGETTLGGKGRTTVSITGRSRQAVVSAILCDWAAMTLRLSSPHRCTS